MTAMPFLMLPDDDTAQPLQKRLNSSYVLKPCSDTRASSTFVWAMTAGTLPKSISRWAANQ
jgi:hypothetical protein